MRQPIDAWLQGDPTKTNGLREVSVAYNPSGCYRAVLLEFEAIVGVGNGETTEAAIADALNDIMRREGAKEATNV